MCDYSLERYQSRPAQQTEEYISNKFLSGTIGFVSPGDPSVAICMACDSELELSHTPRNVQKSAEVRDSAVVTFTRVDQPCHHDAVRFRNGKVLTLQRLGPGVTAWLLPQRSVTTMRVREKHEADLG
jgi:hypothetical protein